MAATNEDEQLLCLTLSASLLGLSYLPPYSLPISHSVALLICLCCSLPLVEHSLNCMSNCIIKIPIKKEALKLAVSAQRQRRRRRCLRLRRLLRWAEVNRKITVEHDKRQCYQRNLINTAPRQSTPPTCSSLSHSPLSSPISPALSATFPTLSSYCKHSTLL